MSIEHRQVRDFDQVNFRGPGTLKIRQGDTESLKVHAPAYMIGDMRSDVDNQILQLGYQSPKVVLLRVTREVVSFELIVRDLKALTLNGLGRVVIPDLDTDLFSLTLRGSGFVLINQLTADQFNANISGSGSVRIMGDVESQHIRLTGSGSYAAADLMSDFADIHLSGSGHAAITASEELCVAISGSGSVSYSGYPEIQKMISGSGKLVRRRKTRIRKKGKGHG